MLDEIATGIAAIIAFFIYSYITVKIFEFFGGEKGKKIAVFLAYIEGIFLLIAGLFDKNPVAICVVIILICVGIYKLVATIKLINRKRKKQKILNKLDFYAQSYIMKVGYKPISEMQKYFENAPVYKKERALLPDFYIKVLPYYEKRLRAYELERIPKLIDEYILKLGCKPINEFERYCKNSSVFESSRSITYENSDFITYAISYYKSELSKKRNELLNRADSIVMAYIESNGYRSLWDFQVYCRKSPSLIEERKCVADLSDELSPYYENELRTYEINRIPFIIDEFIKSNGYKSPYKFKSFCKISKQLIAANSIKYQRNDIWMDYSEYALSKYRIQIRVEFMKKMLELLTPKKMTMDVFMLKNIYNKIPECKEFFLDEEGNEDKYLLANFACPLLNDMVNRGLLTIEFSGDAFQTMYTFRSKTTLNNHSDKNSSNFHENKWSSSELDINEDED